MAAEDDATRPGRRRPPVEAVAEFAIERDDAVTGREPSRRSNGPGHDVIVRAAAASASQPPLPYPAAVARKYYIVPGPEDRASQRRAYADERGEYLMFKDSGPRLATQREEPTVVRDLVAIAEHRAWPALRATGSAGFRREVWLEGSSRGLSVMGYAPTEIDRQALEKRRAEREQRRGSTPQAHRDGTAASERFVPGTPSVDRTGLVGERLEESQARRLAGDSRVPSAPEERAPRSRRDPLLSRLTTASLRDPELAAAHSQLAVLDRALGRALPDDAAMREAVLNVARERLALHLNQGNTIRRAEYALPVRDRAAERSPAREAQQEGTREGRQRRSMRERDR